MEGGGGRWGLILACKNFFGGEGALPVQEFFLTAALCTTFFFAIELIKSIATLFY